GEPDRFVHRPAVPSRLVDDALGEDLDRRRLIRERRTGGHAEGEQAGHADEHGRRHPLQADPEAGRNARDERACSDVDYVDHRRGSTAVLAVESPAGTTGSSTNRTSTRRARTIATGR